MKVGTKSVLFGAHQFLIHPWFVAAGWWKLYGFPFDPRLWVAFFVHDLGYLGKPNMDGPEGEEHPFLGGFIMGCLFGAWWDDFTRYHSRYLARRHGVTPSPLCMADKLAIALTPGWLYVPLARLSGEILEYRSRETRPVKTKGWSGVYDSEGSDWEWWRRVRGWARAYVQEHRDGRPDTWTGITDG